MVSTYAHGFRARLHHRRELLGDAAVGVLDREWVDREIAKIADPPLLERIHLQDRIPRPDHGRLHSNVARTKAWARTVSCPAVKWNADQGNIKFLGLRHVRQTHERRHAGKSRVDKRIHRLGMRSASLSGFHKAREL